MTITGICEPGTGTEQQVDPNTPSPTDHTTWEYNPDDTIHKITDERGRSTTYSYANNNRRLVTASAMSSLAAFPILQTFRSATTNGDWNLGSGLRFLRFFAQDEQVDHPSAPFKSPDAIFIARFVKCFRVNIRKWRCSRLCIGIN